MLCCTSLQFNASSYDGTSSKVKFTCNLLVFAYCVEKQQQHNRLSRFLVYCILCAQSETTILYQKMLHSLVTHTTPYTIGITNYSALACYFTSRNLMLRWRKHLQRSERWNASYSDGGSCEHIIEIKTNKHFDAILLKYLYDICAIRRITSLIRSCNKFYLQI